jgi:hypothetical protein
MKNYDTDRVSMAAAAVNLCHLRVIYSYMLSTGYVKIVFLFWGSDVIQIDFVFAICFYMCMSSVM